jgi:PAS domain S-box-containing protein
LVFTGIINIFETDGIAHLSYGAIGIVSLIVSSIVIYIIIELKMREKALEEVREHYPALVEYNLDAIFTLNLFGDFITANPACFELSGYTREESLGMNFASLLPADEIPKVLKIFKKALSGESNHFQSAFINKSGRRVDLEVTAVPAIVEGKLAGVYGVAKDITTRKRAEEALSESEERYKALFQYNPDTVFSLNPQGEFVSVNPIATAVSGYTAKELLKMESFRAVLLPEEIHKNEKYFIRSMSGESNNYETIILHKKGHRINMEITAVPIFIKGRVTGIHGIAKDISERKRANEALKNFSRKLVENQENERQRIAAELHDGLGQNLLSISNGIKHYLSSIDEEDESVHELSKISSLAIESVEEASEIAYNLHPHILDQLGLKSAIESMVTRTENTSNIEIALFIHDANSKYSKNIEINIFRIIQEGLNNIVKHSCATSAKVSIKTDNKIIGIEISDNGKGIKEKRNSSVDWERGFGLKNIHERVRMFGGNFAIDTKAGKGTVLKVKLPIRDS